MGYLTDKNTVRGTWGEGFLPLMKEPRIKITETHIELVLTREAKDNEANGTQVMTIKEPTGLQMMEMDQETGEMAKSFRLLAACSNLPYAVVTGLPAKDLTLALKVAGAFLSDGR